MSNIGVAIQKPNSKKSVKHPEIKFHQMRYSRRIPMMYSPSIAAFPAGFF